MPWICRIFIPACLIGFNLISFACARDIDISHEAPTRPVVYCLLDNNDSINCVYITKTFIGDGGPLDNARIFDSLFFEKVKVSLAVTGKDEKWVQLNGQQELINNKQEGIFSNPLTLVFSLSQDIHDYDDYNLKVNISGFPQYSWFGSFMDKPKMIYPEIRGSKVSLAPNNPFNLRWGGHWNAWNDVKLSFVIITRTISETRRDTLVYKKTGITEYNSGQSCFFFSFTYSNLLSLFNTYLTLDKDITNRSFESIGIQVHCGGLMFKKYMDLLLWQSDYPFSVIISNDTVLGLVGVKSWQSLDSLVLDPASMHNLLNDPKMKRFKFVEW